MDRHLTIDLTAKVSEQKALRLGARVLGVPSQVVSYGADLAANNGRRVRNVIDSEAYSAFFPLALEQERVIFATRDWNALYRELPDH